MRSNTRKALFIDIDGVIIYDPGYLSDVNEIMFLPGVLESLCKARCHGYYLVFISNKGGVYSKKGFTDMELRKMDKYISSKLIENHISEKSFSTYYCTHYPPQLCSCRKPLSGLFEKAVAEHGIETNKSFAIGDKLSDLIPGDTIGCKLGILVKRNQEYFDDQSETSDNFPRLNSLSDAINFILKQNDNQ
ncbi:MAG: D,D-heptose 1,7-bisphosphate phosphatase [Candidatus Collierbacteria bacterium GW2011_GWC2_43_12]|uniref:D,D-heptose 1,7-bisphosphate phosphatase n=1 Tax=Candidatus Collierbacteria bacterium GW2011_GWC2_43_12 TaxID=1618390 RepID=A0A0G1D0X2_9BACT|nr:MAG: D,D-heptose 1,7-bisphosphate phosphatase [Candidatus Collierbacteria bacterium GW2011_GWC2_43_12]